MLQLNWGVIVNGSVDCAPQSIHHGSLVFLRGISHDHCKMHVTLTGSEHVVV